MSHLRTSSGAKNLIVSAAASFIGMLAAVPVSLAIVSAAQPANAMPVQSQNNQTQTATDASYKQYLQGYTQGYLASVKQDNSSNIDVANCAQPESETSAPTADTTSASYQPMSQASWSQNVNNSYNTYTSSTHTTNNVKTTINKKHVTNINSNNEINSNNTALTDVTVKDSAGAVVTSNATADGTTVTGVDVTNKNSNNTTTHNTSVDIDDSFNTDSHDKTSVIDNSFNHVDTTLNNNTNHPVVDKKHLHGSFHV